jgi:hypothetical protein
MTMTHGVSRRPGAGINERERSMVYRENALSHRETIPTQGRVQMGLLELLLIVLVVLAIAGGIGVSPLLWLLLLVALVVFLTGGGFGYRRGGRA